MQPTPAIVARALQPLAVTGGNATVLPLTIGHCLLLDRSDSRVLRDGATDGLDLFRAVYILTRPAADSETVLARGRETFDAAVLDYIATLESVTAGELAALVYAQIVAAFAPDAQVVFPNEGRGEMLVNTEGNGLGWVLNLIMALFEGGLVTSMRAALEMPVATAIALTIGSAVRNGAEWSEPSYVAADRIDREELATARTLTESAATDPRQSQPDQTRPTPQ